MRNLNIVSNYPEVEPQCEYCAQFQDGIHKYCEFCGAPVPETVWEEVGEHIVSYSGWFTSPVKLGNVYAPIASGPPFRWVE